MNRETGTKRAAVGLIQIAGPLIDADRAGDALRRIHVVHLRPQPGRSKNEGQTGGHKPSVGSSPVMKQSTHTIKS